MSTAVATKLHRTILLAAVLAGTLAGCAREYDVHLVDPRATTETKALYANLKKIAPDHVMFGHQDDLAYGVHWKREEGRSDVKDVTGSYPAVFGWELGDLEHGAAMNLDSVNFEDMKRWIKLGFEAGGVITISWHMDNPASGGSAWDTTRAIQTILPGGEHHAMYRQWLDQFAEFDSDLTTRSRSWLGLATQIPVVFRPFHEHTGSWFWWGGRNVTADEYIQLWRFTVEYLRDAKGLHNLLYAYSPDKFSSVEQYLEYYPGDDYVDILGMDDYSLGGPPDTTGTEPDMTVWRLRTVAQLADEKGKVAALTETGSSGIPNPRWWTDRLLAALKADPEGQRVAWALVWRNARESHHYAPYTGHPSAPDFVQFRNDPMILFADDLPDMYK